MKTLLYMLLPVCGLVLAGCNDDSVINPLPETESSIIKGRGVNESYGEKIKDERWVYDNPGIPFASSERLATVTAKYVDVLSINEGDSHPNADLAADGWKFYNALEFHLVGSTGDMWGYNATYQTYVPLCFGAQNTATAQKVTAVDVNKFSTITEEGYLKMIQMKIPTNATGGASGLKEYGTAAFYANGMGNTYKTSHTPTLVGSRLEVRARIRGNKKGFNMAIWLLGNANAPYGEIDLLENPSGNNSDPRAFQTFHVGATGTTSTSVTKMTMLPEMKDWNIYWMEWPDENTVKIGLNGEVTKILKKGDGTVAEADWAFSREKNPRGLKFILTMGAPNQWAFNGQGTDWVPPVDWDDGFANFTNYMQDRDNEAIPRMEIDWVRTYINLTTEQYENGIQRNKTKFY